MNLERFLREREGDWKELEAVLARARGRPHRLGPEGVLRLGALYRAAAADLALARARFPGDPVVRRLERLVTAGRVAVYGESGGIREGVLGFLATGYWRRVAERPRPLLVAAVLLFGAMALAGLWGESDPGAAIGVVPDQFRGEGPESGDLNQSAGEEAAFSSQIFTNNLQVSFLAFAGGLLATVGTVAVLLYNGLVIGALIGILLDAGQGGVLFELILPHGVLELTCIVVAAAAGLRMGWALVDPGPLTRRAALGAEARRSIEIVIGTAPWFVVAGLIEGFVTGSGLGLGGAIAVGVAAAAPWWALLLWRGRRPTGERRARPAEPGVSPTEAPAT